MPATGPAKPTVLLVGHARMPTGFSRVLDALATRLVRHFEVHLFGTASEPSAPALPGKPYIIHPVPGLPHSAEALVTMAQELRPSACLLLDEPVNCAPQLDALRSLSPRPKLVCYCAADEPGQLPASLLPSLASADCLVAFTRQALSSLQDAFHQAGLAPPACAVLPHGVDTATFRPLPRAEARDTFFGGNRALEDAFIVLNANRNQPFKRVDLTLEGFARFTRNKPPSVKLYLHMGSLPAQGGEPSLADHLGIRDRLLTPATHSAAHPHLADAELNLLYNGCDVGLNTADREGWGLVSFEHGATGAPQIVPALTTLSEVWGNAAWLLPTTPQRSPFIQGRMAPTVRAEDVAEALEHLYSDTTARARWGALAMARAQNPVYQWDTLAEQWSRLLSV